MPDDDGNAAKYVVDDIFPRNLVHLVAAPVGTGKTTLFMQQMHAMQNSLAFLGKQAHPGRVVYISADRGRQETDATLARLGLTGLDFKLVSLKDMRGSVAHLEMLIKQNCQLGDAVIVEPINFFLRDPQNRPGDINNFSHVSHFLLGIGRLVEDMQVTLEGSLHSSKAKQGAEYMAAREKVIGSIAWTAFTATTVVIEPTDPKQVDDPGRTIHVMPRDCAPYTLEYEVDSARGGLMVLSEKEADKAAALENLLIAHPKEEFTARDVEIWAEMARVSRSKTWAWIKAKVESGQVLKLGRGAYQKRKPI